MFLGVPTKQKSYEISNYELHFTDSDFSFLATFNGDNMSQPSRPAVAPHGKKQIEFR
jgi:hypothetical protein